MKSEKAAQNTAGNSGKEYCLTEIEEKEKLPHWLPDGEEVIAACVTSCDFGEKLGQSVCCTVWRAYSEEERSAGRVKLEQTAGRLLWAGEG